MHLVLLLAAWEWQTALTAAEGFVALLMLMGQAAVALVLVCAVLDVLSGRR